MTQIFKPETLSAQKRLRHTELWCIMGHTHAYEPTTVKAKCPKWVDQNIQSFSEEVGLPLRESDFCNYPLVVNSKDFLAMQ